MKQGAKSTDLYEYNTPNKTIGNTHTQTGNRPVSAPAHIAR